MPVLQQQLRAEGGAAAATAGAATSAGEQQNQLLQQQLQKQLWAGGRVRNFSFIYKGETKKPIPRPPWALVGSRARLRRPVPAAVGEVPVK